MTVKYLNIRKTQEAPKDKAGIINSGDPERSSLIWVCTVGQDKSLGQSFIGMLYLHILLVLPTLAQFRTMMSAR